MLATVLQRASDHLSVWQESSPASNTERASDDNGPFTGKYYQLAETLNVPQSLPHPTAAQLCFRIE